MEAMEMARWTKKDECKMNAELARRLREDADRSGRADLSALASYAQSDFLNANECLLSSSAEDKRTGGGGSSAGWALRREAKDLMGRGSKRLKEVRIALEAARAATGR